MAIAICILKTLFGYIILMLAGTNIIGIIVRGLFQRFQSSSENTVVTEMIAEHNRTGIYLNIFFCLIAVLYFYVLYHYWNVGVVIAGAMLMFSRLPDLLYEIKTGEKIKFKNMPRTTVSTVCTIIQWGALPVLWYSLCQNQ